MKASFINEILTHSDNFLNGKRACFTLSLAAILSKSNVLIEDGPGVGKTTMVKYLSKSLGLEFSRIQFTNDLLPTDIIGTNIYDKNSQSFIFHKGPIFGELVLADELNRAPAKTQSALLQAMEEKFISVDGSNFALSDSFTVFATQNPMGQIGTHALPESQLDRFALKFNIGFLDESATIEIMKGQSIEKKLSQIKGLTNRREIQTTRDEVQKVHIEDDILRYIYKLLAVSRENSKYIPLTNRCALDLVKLARAHAYIEDRDYVIPDDIQFLFPYVASHRLSSEGHHNYTSERALSLEILERVSIR